MKKIIMQTLKQTKAKKVGNVSGDYVQQYNLYVTCMHLETTGPIRKMK